MKKLFAIMMAIVMLLSMTAMAATTGSITITPPAGTADGATNTYNIYKVFDAVASDAGISYKLVSGKDAAPAGFKVDAAGNVEYNGTGTELTAADIAAIAAYVAGDAPVATVTATGTANAVAENLPNGYYYITTSTGSVVTIDSTNPNATVNDKNTVPTVDKVITDASSFDEDGKKALAQVGTTVEFEATITVGKGAVGYVFHDTMSAGLAYNNDVAVTGTDAYTVKATPDTGDTITITFEDGIAEGTEIVITYSATVTSDALTVDPANNTAYVSYGDENSSNNKTTDSTTEVYNAKFTVTKQDGNKQPLAGAGFVIKNADGKYYKLANNVVTWVDSIDAADEHISDDNGAVAAFTGLANGTYTLVEKTVPAGYNKAADSTFTVIAGDYTAENLAQGTIVENKTGTELPSTGGMGTTLFYVVGSLMMAAAVVVLVAKKKVAAK